MEELSYIPYVKIVLAFIFSLYLLRKTAQIAPRVYSIRFVSGYYTFQFAAIFLYLVILPDGIINNDESVNIPLKEHVDEIIFGYFLFQGGILLAALIGRVTFSKLYKKSPFVNFVQARSKYLTPLLVFGAIVTLIYPFTNFIPGIGYAITILFNFTKFLPFVAGLLFFSQKKLTILWIISLSILFVMGILTGGRGTAMLSGIIFSLGFYYALTSKKARMIAVVSASVIAIPMFSFFTLVGIFRHVVGRVDFSKIDVERMIKVYSQYQKLKDSKKLDLNSDVAKNQGWGRLVNFVNIYQFVTIPSQRPYLGFENMFSTDFLYAYDLSFISGTTREDRVRNKSANFRLVDYGYRVNIEYSVEYSIVTDSYIRFGYNGVFIFGFIISFFSQILELIITFISKKNAALYVMGVVMICQQALWGYSYNIFVITRSMIIATLTAIAIVWLLQFINAVFKPARNRA